MLRWSGVWYRLTEVDRFSSAERPGKCSLYNSCLLWQDSAATATGCAGWPRYTRIRSPLMTHIHSHLDEREESHGCTKKNYYIKIFCVVTARFTVVSCNLFNILKLLRSFLQLEPSSCRCLNIITNFTLYFLNLRNNDAFICSSGQAINASPEHHTSQSHWHEIERHYALKVVHKYWYSIGWIHLGFTYPVSHETIVVDDQITPPPKKKRWILITISKAPTTPTWKQWSVMYTPEKKKNREQRTEPAW